MFYIVMISIHNIKAALGYPVLLHEDYCCSVPFGLIWLVWSWEAKWFTIAVKLSILPWTNHHWRSINAEKSGRIRACFQLFIILHIVKKNVREAGWRKKRKLNNIKFTKFVSMTLISSYMMLSHWNATK